MMGAICAAGECHRPHDSAYCHAIGYVIDAVVFKSVEYYLQHMWGLAPTT
jgi:hypothetical protein